MTKRNKRYCIDCGKETNTVLGADPDLTGIAVCQDHKRQVREDLMILLMNSLPEFDEEWFNEKYNNKTD